MKQHMKTIGLVLVSLLAFTACKVEYIPEGNKEQGPFQTMQDVKWTREAMFEAVRGAESPGNLYIGDWQADLYNVDQLRDNGGYGPFYDWDPALLVNSDNVASYYAAFSSLIKDANYFLMRAEELKANDTLFKTFSEADVANFNIYVAESRTLRALGHYRLMTRFSTRYNDTNDGGDLGIVMMKKYDPLFKELDKKRATQKVVYTWCLAELEEAAKSLPTKGAYNDLTMDGIPCYLVDDYAYAVRSRILLEMHRYKDAISEVEKFIDNYPLTSKREDFSKIWKEETSSEIMIKTYANKKVGLVSGVLHGIHYRAGALADGSDVELVVPTWFPTQYLIDLYEKPIDTDTDPAGKDWRYLNWFEKGAAQGPNGVMVYVYDARPATFVSKFRGNPALDQDRSKHLYSYVHTTHLFDIAEAWLIKAEAQAWDGDVSGAKSTLQDLRMARGLGDPLSATTQDQIKKTVMNERTREMLGMGTRMTDLKRCKVDLDRRDKPAQAALVDEEGVLHTKSLDLHKSHTDKMFIWEFPLQDRFANKELIPNW